MRFIIVDLLIIFAYLSTPFFIHIRVFSISDMPLTVAFSDTILIGMDLSNRPMVSRSRIAISLNARAEFPVLLCQSRLPLPGTGRRR